MIWQYLVLNSVVVRPTHVSEPSGILPPWLGIILLKLHGLGDVGVLYQDSFVVCIDGLFYVSWTTVT